MQRLFSQSVATRKVLHCPVCSELFQNLSRYVAFAVRFCNCISTTFLSLHYHSVRNYFLPYFFQYRIELDLLQIIQHGISLYIRVQSDRKTKRRQGYMSKNCLCKKKLNSNLCWFWLWYSLNYKKLGFVTIGLQLNKL